MDHADLRYSRNPAQAVELWLSDKSAFAEVNHFEKRNKDSILHFSCNQRFGRVMAFLFPMDVSVV